MRETTGGRFYGADVAATATSAEQNAARDIGGVGSIDGVLRAGAAVGILVVLAGCTGVRGGDKAGPGGETIHFKGRDYPKSELRGAVAALCRVEHIAGKSPKRAGDLFLNQSHDDLHVIAGAAERRSRKVSGALLVAMESLEAAFEQGKPGSVVSGRAATLSRRANSALDTLDIPAVTCGGER